MILNGGPNPSMNPSMNPSFGGQRCRSQLSQRFAQHRLGQNHPPAVRTNGRSGAQPIDNAVQVEQMRANLRLADLVSDLNVLDANGTARAATGNLVAALRRQ
mmetsp:Transcript_5055/g.12419  ORF Transcript_5055/g.12419 Transcript_5055/m.12419 type:complete len:102 (-) Transcript_5055:46-351(-)